MTLFVILSAMDANRFSKCVFKKENCLGPIPSKGDMVFIKGSCILIQRIEWNLTSEEVTLVGNTYIEYDYDELPSVSIR